MLKSFTFLMKQSLFSFDATETLVGEVGITNALTQRNSHLFVPTL